MNEISPDEKMDLTGVACPANAARALLKLEGMNPGSMLEIIIDDGEPAENVPGAIEEEGHAILSTRRYADNRWILLIKRM